MITLDKQKQTFSSMYNTYDVMSVEPSLMYQWIKTGEAKGSDFKFWLQLQLEGAELKGREWKKSA